MNCLLGQRRSYPAMPQILQHARLAESLVGQPRRGIALGELAVVEILALFETCEDAFYILCPLRAPAQFFTHFACRMRSAAQRT
jgi:hypothetical protein